MVSIWVHQKEQKLSEFPHACSCTFSDLESERAFASVQGCCQTKAQRFPRLPISQPHAHAHSTPSGVSRLLHVNNSVISQCRICRNGNHGSHTLLAPAPSPTAAAAHQADDAAAVGAIAARGCLFESSEPREPLSTSGTPQPGRQQPWPSRGPPQPRPRPSPGPSCLAPGTVSQAGRAVLGAGRGGRARRRLARAIVCWPGTRARPGGVLGWFPSPAAAGLRRQQQWDFAVPASGCKGSGGLGRGEGARRRQLRELCRDEAFGFSY